MTTTIRVINIFQADLSCSMSKLCAVHLGKAYMHITLGGPGYLTQIRKVLILFPVSMCLKFSSQILRSSSLANNEDI
jgi:hypothetical protein